MSKKIKKGLGSGLDNLIGPGNFNDIQNIEVQYENTGQPLYVSFDKIKTNPDQPRKHFNKVEMETLKESIKLKGIIEPLIVHKIDSGYELIAGHRRLLAAKEAGLTEVPLIINDILDSPEERLELALVENLIRDDLNPIEEAEAYERLEKEFGRSHIEISKLSGHDRSTIANTIRLLKLPEAVRDDIRFRRLSPGHGRALLSLENTNVILEARSIVLSSSLTVRQTESLVKKLNRKISHQDNEEIGDKAYFDSLAKSFSQSLGGLKVNIIYKSKNKKIEITFKSNLDIENLMKKLDVKPV